MELTNEQRDTLAGWLSQGAKPNEVQKRLESEFGIKLTFMQVRFLLDDLGLELTEKKQSKPDTVLPPDSPLPANIQDVGPEGQNRATVTLDAIQRPGAMISGVCQFAKGKQIAWQIDQMGRLGLLPDASGYKPTQDDIADFQDALQQVLQEKGFA